MSKFSNTLDLTVISVEDHSFTASDGKDVAYTDALVVDSDGDIYVVRDTRGRLSGLTPGETVSLTVSLSGKVSKVSIRVLRIEGLS